MGPKSIGSWLAEAGVVLERIRFGTYRPEEIDIDTMNATFYDAMNDVAFPDVRAQARSPGRDIEHRALDGRMRWSPIRRCGAPVGSLAT